MVVELVVQPDDDGIDASRHAGAVVTGDRITARGLHRFHDPRPPAHEHPFTAGDERRRRHRRGDDVTVRFDLDSGQCGDVLGKARPGRVRHEHDAVAGAAQTRDRCRPNPESARHSATPRRRDRTARWAAGSRRWTVVARYDIVSGVPRFEPFRALRYAATDLGDLVAPPYDVLSADDVATLAARSDHNIVHVDVPVGGDDRYARAAQTMHAWMADGVLALDDVDSFTIYRTRFTDAAGSDRDLVGVLGGHRGGR